MTNEEYLEEILYKAHELGLIEELSSRVPKNIDYSKKIDIYINEFLKIIKEKNIDSL